MFNRIREDIQAVFNHDPAAKNILEVVTCYPGLHAIWIHRLAHWLYRRRFYTLARMISHLGRFLTGVEIHPGATLGRRVFIDHGMGVVIGETAGVGDDCLLYKGVVLGGTSLEKKKRHPTLGQGVVVGSNACILGAIEIGDHARIGSGSVIVRSVPAEATAVGIPGKVVLKKTTGDLSADLEHGNMPDPMLDVVKVWLRLLKKYEERLKRLEAEHQIQEPELVKDYQRELEFLSPNEDNEES